MSASSIAVIGGGFSGTLLALHALRRAPAGTSVCLIERSSQFGRGAAYATGNPNHLLNVPAGRMSAFHDRPSDFLNWLRVQPGFADSGEQSFVPRRLFGAYVRHLLNRELKSGAELDLVRGRAVRIRDAGGAMEVHLDRNRRIRAEKVVLATGNFPPEPPPAGDPSFFDGPHYRADPWAPDTLTALDPDAPVGLIGTGLTMVDVVISLLDRGHRGPILALSRRGLLPLRHSPAPLRPVLPHRPFPASINELLRFLRAESADMVAGGGSWQPTVDSLRPFTVDVWQAMPAKDRARFLRHLRPWWDIHRHRIPPAVADRIAAARANLQLCTAAGRIRALGIQDGMVEIVWRPRFGTDTVTARVSRLINCSGPCADYARIADPLIRDLLDTGTARPDSLRLGLDVTGACALLDAAGRISPRLFAVGPITKGAFWEMTAVPDIRRQCEFLAAHLAGLVRPAGARVLVA